MDNILELLVCSVTKGRLEYDRQQQLLISKQAKLAYQITNGIPDMRIETALDLTELEQPAEKFSGLGNPKSPDSEETERK